MVIHSADDFYATLFKRAEQALLAGRLPRKLATRVRGLRGSGCVCTLCAEPIGPGEAQIDLQPDGPEPDTPRVRLHFGCYRLWELVRQRLAERNRTLC